MTLRQSIARRAELVASLSDLAAFILSLPPEFDALVDWGATVIELPFVVQSKEEADEIIKAYDGARPIWRNGVYMAEWDPPAAPPGFLPDGYPPKLLPGDPGRKAPRGRCPVELHFAPAITEQEAA